MRHIFGPVPSRRFGLSLGIDLSPEHKSCNFDCLYCELDPAKPTNTIPHPAPPTAIIQEVKEALQRYPDVEVLTITANGEPTLYPYLEELIDKLQHIKGRELLILSNGSTIYRPDIQKALRRLDIVKLSLDCATPRCFKRLDRPLKEIELSKIIEETARFARSFEGLLVIEILVVKGINDTPKEFAALNEALQTIKPHRIDLGTIDRPPAYKVQRVSYQKLLELSRYLQGLPVCIVTREHQNFATLSLSEEEILHLLSLRPLTLTDIQSTFDAPSLKRFSLLLDKGLIKRQNVGKIEFFEAQRELD